MERVNQESLKTRIERLKSTREHNKMSYRDVATIAHTTPETICLMECGIYENIKEVYSAVERLEKSIFMIRD